MVTSAGYLVRSARQMVGRWSRGQVSCLFGPVSSPNGRALVMWSGQLVIWLGAGHVGQVS
jgi:hypothetical protein